MDKSCGYSSYPSSPNYFQPPNITTRSNRVEIFFHTDASDTKPGWSLSWSAVTPGSVCPSPIPPTADQPCTLPGALYCNYESFIDNQGGTGNCCCGQCDIDMTCAPDSTTGSGLW